MQFLEALIELNCFSHCDVQLHGGNLNLKWPNLLLWRYAAESLVLGLSVEAKAYPQVALLFGHISNFSQLIDHNSAEQVHAVLCLFCDQLKGVVVVVQHCVPLVFCFFLLSKCRQWSWRTTRFFSFTNHVFKIKLSATLLFEMLSSFPFFFGGTRWFPKTDAGETRLCAEPILGALGGWQSAWKRGRHLLCYDEIKCCLWPQDLRSAAQRGRPAGDRRPPLPRPRPRSGARHVPGRLLARPLGARRRRRPAGHRRRCRARGSHRHVFHYCRFHSLGHGFISERISRSVVFLRSLMIFIGNGSRNWFVCKLGGVVTISFTVPTG